ncbi:hypothetical protein RJ639_035266 [Escallonia herrerae]|uniref:1-aminocyclopropane-1-carboxylate oxidase n=1 Tax=Escallonia herrerae TaxID=1293975 RepID=A0AA88WPN2_9ASTE|nr:hypothetical protein RJ639_035266 [Escallonia herrerae]
MASIDVFMECFFLDPFFFLFSHEIISNGEYNSVQHRVLANANKEPRISIVEFFNFGNQDGSKRYGPIPELLSAEKSALYRTFTKQEFDQNFFSKGLDSKSLVEKLRIEG